MTELTNSQKIAQLVISKMLDATDEQLVLVRRDDLDIVEKYIDHDLMVEKGDMLADQAFERILAITHEKKHYAR